MNLKHSFAAFNRDYAITELSLYLVIKISYTELISKACVRLINNCEITGSLFAKSDGLLLTKADKANTVVVVERAQYA